MTSEIFPWYHTHTPLTYIGLSVVLKCFSSKFSISLQRQPKAFISHRVAESILGGSTEITLFETLTAPQPLSPWVGGGWQGLGGKTNNYSSIIVVLGKLERNILSEQDFSLSDNKMSVTALLTFPLAIFSPFSGKRRAPAINGTLTSHPNVVLDFKGRNIFLFQLWPFKWLTLAERGGVTQWQILINCPLLSLLSESVLKRKPLPFFPRSWER